MSRGGRVTMFPRDGWWIATWWETTRDGERKKRQKRLGTQDERRAEIERAKLDADLMAGRLSGERRARVGFDEFLRDYEAAYIAAGGSEARASRITNWAKERRALDRLFAFARARKLASIDQITRPLVDKMKREMIADELATATVNHDVRVIRAAFSWAAGEGSLLDEHPLKDLKQLKEPQRAIVWLRQADAEVVVRVAQDYMAGRILLLCLYLGLRLSEATHAREGDADLDANLFRVRNRPEEGFLTKSRQLRSIPIAPELRTLLLAWRTEDPSRLICPDPQTRKALKKDQVRHACAAIKRKYGVTFSPHTLRRTFASLLRERGVPIEKISAYLGHSSIAITQKWYAGLELTGDDTDVAKLTFAARPAPGTVVERPAEEPDEDDEEEGGPEAATA